MTATTERSKISAPTPDQFEEDANFAAAPDLAYLAGVLIAEDRNRFGFLDQVDIAYLWKKKGGKRRGNLTLGMTKKATGDLKYFSGMQIVIWLAADHHGERTPKQIEATLYHELLHVVPEYDEDTGDVKPKLVGHDFEGFAAEVSRYGEVLEDVQAIAPAFRQLELFDGER